MTTLYASYGDWKYSRHSVKNRAQYIVNAILELQPLHEFDGVIVTGSSGVWLGGLLQAHDQWPEGLPIILCRKQGENSHGPMVECDLPSGKSAPERVLLLDDFVATGDTVRRVQGAYRDFGKVTAVLEHCHLETHDGLEVGKALFCRKAVDGAQVFCRRESW